MLEEGTLGGGRRGSRTPESGDSCSNQSPQPDSWRKKRRNESKRWRTLRRPQRGASGLPLLDSRNGLGFGSVVLHRDHALVPELHDGRGLAPPVAAADLARVRDDDHGLFSAVSELQLAPREALVVTLTQRPDYIVTSVAVPLTRLEPAPLHIWVEDLLDRLEVALTPSLQALPRDLGRLAVHVTRIRRCLTSRRASLVRSQPRSAAAAGTAPPARAIASPRAALRSRAPRRAAVRLPPLGPAAMSHSLCWRSLREAERQPELAASRDCRFPGAARPRRARRGVVHPISIRSVEVSSFLSDLPVDAFGGRVRSLKVARARAFARARAGGGLCTAAT